MSSGPRLGLCEHRDPYISFMKQGLETVSDVLAPENLQRMRHLLEVAPVTNIVSEKSFAGSHTRRMTDHGQSPKLPTLASQHVLAESKIILDSEVCRRSCSCQPVAPAVSHAGAGSGATNNGWVEFVRANSQPGQSFRALSQQWAAQGRDGKARFATAAKSRTARRPPASPQLAPPPQLAPAAPERPRAVWPHCGNDFYPLRQEVLGDMAGAIRSLAACWMRRVGEGPCKPAQAIAQECGPWCRGDVCVATLTDPHQRALEYMRVKLNRFSAFSKTKVPALEDMWEALPVLHVNVRDAAGSGSSADQPRGATFLQLCPLHDNQVFCLSEKSGVPAVGAVLRFQPDISNLRGAVEVAQLCASLQPQRSMSCFQASVQCWRLRCEHQGLATFKVAAIEDMADMEEEAASRRRRDKDASKVASALARMDDNALLQPKRRRIASKRAATAAREPRGSSVPTHVAGCQPDRGSSEEALREEELRQLDDELDAGAEAVADGDIYTVMEQEILQVGACAEDLAEMKQADAEEAARECRATQASAESGHAPNRQAGPQAARHVRMDAESGRVFCTNTNRYLGRLTHIRVNTPQEAFSVYCSLHGCQLMRPVRRAPSTDELLEDAAVQRKHKASFPEPST